MSNIHGLAMRIPKQPKPLMKMPKSVSRPEKTVALVEPGDEEKWVWNGKGTSTKVINSLEWMVDYKDEEGKDMTKKQISDSFANYDKWLDDLIERETAIQLKKNNNKLMA